MIVECKTDEEGLVSSVTVTAETEQEKEDVQALFALSVQMQNLANENARKSEILISHFGSQRE